MFGTLQYDSNNNDIEFVEKADGFHSNLGAEQHSACDHCRAKKLRCSGYKNGCTRCKGLGRVCTYSGSRDGKGGKRRRRRDDSKSSISAGKVISPTAKNSQARPTVNTNCLPVTVPATITPAESVKSFSMETPIDSPLRSLDDTTNMWADMLCDLSPGIPHFGLANPMDRACLSPVSDPDKDGLLYDPMLMDSIIANEGHNPTTFLTDPGFFAETAHAMMAEPMRTINPSETEKFPSPPSSHRGSISSYVAPPSAAMMANAYFPSHTRSSSENIPSPASSQSMCGCLQTVVGLLEDLDANTVSGAAAIDSMLSSQKEALDYSKNMLACMQCAARSEHMTLLNFVATKMVALCEQIVERYVAHTQNPTAAEDFRQLNLARRNSSHRGSPGADAASAAAMAAASNPTAAAVGANMFLGDYEVNSPVEWDYLVRVLIVLQLRGLQSFLAEMKKVAQPALRDTQFSKLLMLEGQVAELSKVMARVEKEAGQR